jgi:tRNA A-37 threonylcarbamoyl transferase component Bud32
MSFRPTLTSQITISGTPYGFPEHPYAKGMPYGQTGRRATVYQVQDIYGRVHALKVFTRAFRSEQIAHSAVSLRLFATLPGLKVCARHVLTSQEHPELIGQYPDLEYAVLMPWANGKTWQEMILERQPLSAQESLMLARSLAATLAGMEKSNLAHCDLSGANLLVSNQGAGLSLVDVEEMYAPGFEQPPKLPAGSAGYAHRVAREGLWHEQSDRFAGAVLLAEMLGWCDASVHDQSGAEQYFSETEMQADSPRYRHLANFIYQTWGEETATLFHKTWFSPSLGACPTFSEWLTALQQASQRAAVSPPVAAVPPPAPVPVSPVGSRPIVPAPVPPGQEVARPPVATPQSSGGMPAWGWVAIVLVGLFCLGGFALAGGGALLAGGGTGSFSSSSSPVYVAPVSDNVPLLQATATRRATATDAPIIAPAQATRTPTRVPTQTRTPSPVPNDKRAQISSEVYFAALRKSPGYSAKNDDVDILVEIPSGSTVRVLDGPRSADGLNWWYISWNGYEGWVAEKTGRGKTILIFTP